MQCNLFPLKLSIAVPQSIEELDLRLDVAVASD